MKVELRYFDRKTANRYTTGGQTIFDVRETVLQYRQADHTFNNGPGNSTTVWSDWQDVPTVKEE